MFPNRIEAALVASSLLRHKPYGRARTFPSVRALFREKLRARFSKRSFARISDPTKPGAGIRVLKSLTSPATNLSPVG